MRKYCLPAGFLLAALCLPAHAAAQATPRPLPRGNQCLDPAQARGFVDLDQRRLLVDAGRKRYLIHLAPACWKLDLANAIGLRGDPVTGRVCGGMLESVLVRGEVPCRIEGMEVLSNEQYQAALREREQLRRGRRAAREAAKQR
jgi:hypothetical protein